MNDKGVADWAFEMPNGVKETRLVQRRLRLLKETYDPFLYFLLLKGGIKREGVIGETVGFP